MFVTTFCLSVLLSVTVIIYIKTTKMVHFGYHGIPVILVLPYQLCGKIQRRSCPRQDPRLKLRKISQP